MKAQGIIIMTILVEVETESTGRCCATAQLRHKPEYAFTPTSAQLNSTFTTIANELSSLRLYR